MNASINTDMNAVQNYDYGILLPGLAGASGLLAEWTSQEQGLNAFLAQ